MAQATMVKATGFTRHIPAREARGLISVSMESHPIYGYRTTVSTIVRGSGVDRGLGAWQDREAAERMFDGLVYLFRTLDS